MDAHLTQACANFGLESLGFTGVLAGFQRVSIADRRATAALPGGQPTRCWGGAAMNCFRVFLFFASKRLASPCRSNRGGRRTRRTPVCADRTRAAFRPLFNLAVLPHNSHAVDPDSNFRSQLYTIPAK
jgi:hypothetical protein